jgi:DNA polymerase III epsilon subunit family exonuclease
MIIDAILKSHFLVYDLEMTGLDPEKDEIIEMATVPMTGERIEQRDGFFVQLNPQRSINVDAKKVHGISGDKYDMAQLPQIETVLPQFISQAFGKIIVGQNPALDLEFLQVASKISAIMLPRFRVVDISRLFYYFYPVSERYNLDEIAMRFGLRRREGVHNAWDDALLTAKIFSRMLKKLYSLGIETERELLNLTRI